MAYATVQYFIDTFGEEESLELSQIDRPDAETIAVDVIQRALDLATAEVSSYLAGRYLLPLTQPYPTVLAYKTIVIARKILDKNLRRENVKADFDEVIAQLRDYATGKATLVGDDGKPIDNSPTQGRQEYGAIGVGEGTQTFTDENLGDYDRDFLYFGRR